MSYLLSQGHRRIAYVGSHIKECLEGSERWTSGRWQTYRDELKRAGIAIDTDMVVEIAFGTEPGSEIARKVVDLMDLDVDDLRRPILWGDALHNRAVSRKKFRKEKRIELRTFPKKIRHRVSVRNARLFHESRREDSRRQLTMVG